MRGPQTTDIDQLLSGLKMKAPEPTRKPEPNSPFDFGGIGGNSGNESVISLSSLKDLDSTEMPKQIRKRQNRSDKNTISLDI
jgi:hypothetical protein